MRVLVPGGAGYIGAHTCKVLALAVHMPIAYDNGALSSKAKSMILLSQ